MNVISLGLVPAVFGFVGAFTPCALGINAIFVGQVAAKVSRPNSPAWHWMGPESWL